MPRKKRPVKDKFLIDFLKSDGRKHAEADFNTILRKAVKPSSTRSNKKPRAHN